MNLAVSNIAWDVDDGNSIYSLMYDHNIMGLEVAPTKYSENPYDHVDRAKLILRKIHDDFGIRVVSMQALLYGQTGLALFEDEGKRELLKEYLKKAIIYAQAIQCPTLVFGNPKQRISYNPERDYDVGVQFFKELGDFAHEHNTTLCIEPNPIEYGTNYINTLQDAYALVCNAESKGFGMIVDTSTMLLNNDSAHIPEKILRVVKHIHVSMPYLKQFDVMFHEYREWFLELFRQIKKSCYDYYCSLEMIHASYNNLATSFQLLRSLS